MSSAWGSSDQLRDALLTLGALAESLGTADAATLAAVSGGITDAAQQVVELAADVRSHAVRRMLASMTVRRAGEMLGMSYSRVHKIAQASKIDVSSVSSASPARVMREAVTTGRHAQYPAAEQACRGYFYWRSYRGRRDPMIHFFGARFREELASEELLEWWISSGQRSIRVELQPA